MPLDKNRQFLDFEKPIKELFDEIEKLRQTAEKTKVDLSDSINKLYDQVTERQRYYGSPHALAESPAQPPSRPPLYDEVY